MIDVEVKSPEDLVVPRLAVHQGLAVEILGLISWMGFRAIPRSSTSRWFWGRVMGRMGEMTQAERRCHRRRFRARALAMESGSGSMRIRRRSSWVKSW